ncbi:Growth-regulating factor 8 [Linum grandiflorum]
MGKRRSGVSSVKERQTNPRTKMVSSEEEEDCGLALKLQKLPSCNGMELLIPHDHDHGGGRDESGPFCCSRSSTNSVSSSVPDFTHVYDGGGGTGGLLPPPPPAAHVLPAHFHPHHSNHSPGEMSAAAATSPFTAAQSQELERQTIILKYLMASVPVPPDLIPKLKPPNMGRHSLKLGISTSESDPEPWRCKRTDGKKWRCSRDSAPDHKYCERHARKNRPRSRKPVEFHFDPVTAIDPLLNPKPDLQGLTTSSYLPFFPPATATAPATTPADAAIPYDEPPRNMEWFLKGETDGVPSDSNQGWHYMSKEDDKDSSFELDHTEKIPTYSSSSPLQCDWLGNDDHYNSWLSSLPKSTTSMDAATAPSPGGLTQGQETRHFLDAWSTTTALEKNTITGDKKSSPVSPADKAALPLTLSMCGGGTGGGSESTETSYEEVEGTSELGMRGGTQWLPDGSWPMSSPPGGPLAEALCLGISSSGSKSPPDLASAMNSTFPNKW